MWGGALECFTCLNNFLYIFYVDRPVETLSDGHRRQCPWAYVRPTNFGVNLSEELLAFALGYALEKWLDYAFFVQGSIY